MRPTLVCCPAGRAKGEAIARTSRKTVRIRFPSCAIRSRSAPRVMRARRGKPSDGLGASGSCVLVRDSDGELLPSLFAAASKCLTTPLGLHTRTKPVRLEPPRVTRAVRWLPHNCSSWTVFGGAMVQTGKLILYLEIGQPMSSAHASVSPSFAQF